VCTVASPKKFTLSEIQSMKVADLRLELKQRGLLQTGPKDVLVERLKQDCSKTRKKFPPISNFPLLGSLHQEIVMVCPLICL
jgi:hypothetical protein